MTAALAQPASCLRPPQPLPGPPHLGASTPSRRQRPWRCTAAATSHQTGSPGAGRAEGQGGGQGVRGQGQQLCGWHCLHHTGRASTSCRKYAAGCCYSLGTCRSCGSRCACVQQATRCQDEAGTRQSRQITRLFFQVLTGGVHLGFRSLWYLAEEAQRCEEGVAIGACCIVPRLCTRAADRTLQWWISSGFISTSSNVQACIDPVRCFRDAIANCNAGCLLEQRAHHLGISFTVERPLMEPVMTGMPMATACIKFTSLTACNLGHRTRSRFAAVAYQRHAGTHGDVV